MRRPLAGPGVLVNQAGKRTATAPDSSASVHSSATMLRMLIAEELGDGTWMRWEIGTTRHTGSKTSVAATDGLG